MSNSTVLGERKCFLALCSIATNFGLSTISTDQRLHTPRCSSQEELESVQKRKARFVTGYYNYETRSMTGILWQLKWESLKKRRKDNRLILLYKGLKGKASVPTDDLIPKTRRCRNKHSMAFQTPIANTDVLKVASYPRLSGIGAPSPILWSHPLKMQRIVLLSSLLWWELGTYSLITGPGEWLSFGVLPVNYPDPVCLTRK